MGIGVNNGRLCFKTSDKVEKNQLIPRGTLESIQYSAQKGFLFVETSIMTNGKTSIGFLSDFVQKIKKNNNKKK